VPLGVDVGVLRDGQDTHAGTITWDGQTFQCVPDTPLLREIVAEPISGPGGTVLSPERDPEAFLRALNRQYHSAYLRVSAAREV
jgi:hypothetical protein